MPADPRTKTEYVKRMDDLLRSVNKLEYDAVRRAIVMLDEARKEINRRVLTEEAGWRVENLANLRAQSTDIIREYMRRYASQFDEMQRAALLTGIELVDEPLRISGVSLSPARLSANMIAVMQGRSAQLVQSVTQDTITGIDAILSSAVLGLQSPFEAQKALTRLMGTDSVYRSVQASRGRDGPDALQKLTGISAKAERVFRTEIGEAQGIATQARQNEVAASLDDAMKMWVAAGDSRNRPGHLDAHGQKVPVGGTFRVRSKRSDPFEELRFPKDPAASAGNRIHCRCRSVIWRESYGDVLPRTDARVRDEVKKRAEESYRHWGLGRWAYT